MLKNWYITLLVFLVLAFGSTTDALAKYASIVVNENSGKVLYARNADSLLFPASLTKVMTLYIVFEELEAGKMTLNTQMKVSRVAAGRSPSKLGLRVGSHIRLREAMYSLITKSANDAATVIAEHISKTEREFAKRMTRKAHALGMSKTTFRNASGLPHWKQQSTARDMARLAIAIRKDFPQYFKVFQTQTYSWNGKKFRNHNKLLRNFNGTDGIKTGYTKASGFNLMASVERDGVRLVGIVFGGRTSASRDAHMKKILTRQFEKLAKQPQPLIQAKLTQPPSPSRTIQAPPPRPTIALAEHKNRIQDIIAEGSKPPPDLPELNDPEITIAESSQNWAIQVGSFAHRPNAHIAAKNARALADDLLYNRAAYLREIRLGNTTLWRVQFLNMNEVKARTTCNKLHQKGMACIAIPSPRI